MARRQKKKETFNTPIGIALWCCTGEPDYEYQEQGQWYIKMLLPDGDPDTMGFLQRIDEASEEAFDEVTADWKPKERKVAVVGKPYSAHLDEETGDETGMIQVTFKRNASYKDRKTGKTRPITPAPVFNADGTPFDGEFIPADSKIEVSFYLRNIKYPGTPPGAGVRLEMAAVMIHEMGEGGGASSASAYGFSPREQDGDPEDHRDGDDDDGGETGEHADDLDGNF